MSSSRAPIVQVYLADAAISKGMAVKFGTDFKHVAKSSANTNHHIGIAQSAPTTAEDAVEIAMPGGGAKALLGGTVAIGDYLTGHTDGSLVVCDGAGDVIIAQAMQAGVVSDIIDVSVVMFVASGANA